MTKPTVGLRWFVWFVLVFGLTASVLANVADARPDTVARIISGVVPFAMFLALEMALRVRLQTSTGREKVVAAGRLLAHLAIAGIAAVVSYGHMVGTALKYGQPDYAAHLMPFAIDGLIVVATINLFALRAPARASIFWAPRMPVVPQVPETAQEAVAAPEPDAQPDTRPTIPEHLSRHEKARATAEYVTDPPGGMDLVPFLPGLVGATPVEAARVALREQPDLTAVQLRDWLNRHGYRTPDRNRPLSRDGAYQALGEARAATNGSRTPEPAST